MKRHRWQLQEAKNQLSQVVENALTDQPQVITRHGKDTVVVVAHSEWIKQSPQRKKLLDILRACPVPGFEIPRDRDRPRPVEL